MVACARSVSTWSSSIASRRESRNVVPPHRLDRFQISIELVLSTGQGIELLLELQENRPEQATKQSTERDDDPPFPFGLMTTGLVEREVTHGNTPSSAGIAGRQASG